MFPCLFVRFDFNQLKHIREWEAFRRSCCLVPKDPITFSDDEQGVHNHLLTKVFRFHYHSQVIGSLGGVVFKHLHTFQKKQPLSLEIIPSMRTYISHLRKENIQFLDYPSQEIQGWLFFIFYMINLRFGKSTVTAMGSVMGISGDEWSPRMTTSPRI